MPGVKNIGQQQFNIMSQAHSTFGRNFRLWKIVPSMGRNSSKTPRKISLKQNAWGSLMKSLFCSSPRCAEHNTHGLSGCWSNWTTHSLSQLHLKLHEHQYFCFSPVHCITWKAWFLWSCQGQLIYKVICTTFFRNYSATSRDFPHVQSKFSTLNYCS